MGNMSFTKLYTRKHNMQMTPWPVELSAKCYEMVSAIWSWKTFSRSSIFIFKRILVCGKELLCYGYELSIYIYIISGSLLRICNSPQVWDNLKYIGQGHAWSSQVLSYTIIHCLDSMNVQGHKCHMP